MERWPQLVGDFHHRRKAIVSVLCMLDVATSDSKRRKDLKEEPHPIMYSETLAPQPCGGSKCTLRIDVATSDSERRTFLKKEEPHPIMYGK